MKIGLIIIAIIFLCIILIMSPFIIHMKDVENFCNDLSSKNTNIIDIDYITKSAEEKGLSVNAIPEESFLFIYDKKTLAKLTCNIDYSGDEITYRYNVD